MGYKDLVESGASTPEMQSYLTDSELVTVTLRLPRTMRDSAKEYATLNGLNFTSLVKQCLIEKLTKKIYARYTGMLEKWQCRRIAQTETMIGTAEAGDMAARTLDVRFTKQWCTSGLSNVRDSHAAVDGVTVDENEPFKLPGGLLMYPHDTSMGADASEIINCACDVIRRAK